MGSRDRRVLSRKRTLFAHSHQYRSTVASSAHTERLSCAAMRSRLHLAAASLSPTPPLIMLVDGADAAPHYIPPAEIWSAPVGAGIFGCCSLGHASTDGRPMACARVRAQRMLGGMINTKLQALHVPAGAAHHLARLSAWRWLQCAKARLLIGLPSPASDRQDAATAHTDVTLDALKRQLAWTGADDAAEPHTGLTLLHYAALCSAAAVRELLAAGGEDAARLVTCAVTCDVPEIGLRRGSTPLHVAMLGAHPSDPFVIVEALLDAGADPRAADAAGCDALLRPCVEGNLGMVRAWLQRFPAHFDAGGGGEPPISSLCATVALGWDDAQPVVALLLEHRAPATHVSANGEVFHALHLASANPSTSRETLLLLLSHAGDGGIDQPVRPLRRQSAVASYVRRRSSLRQPALQLIGPARTGGRGHRLAESTALHLAAIGGCVQSVQTLVAAGASGTCRDAQSLTPLAAAQRVFGVVPSALAAELTSGSAASSTHERARGRSFAILEAEGDAINEMNAAFEAANLASSSSALNAARVQPMLLSGALEHYGPAAKAILAPFVVSYASETASEVKGGCALFEPASAAQTKVPPFDVGDTKQSATAATEGAPSASPPVRAGAELRALMEGSCSTPLERLCTVAGKLREPDYSLYQFHDDMLSCFPELRLYLVGASTSSGRTTTDEYQRTIGALFAVYWFARIDVDRSGEQPLVGQHGLCFGVDDDWQLPTAEALEQLAQSGDPQMAKRAALLDRFDWKGLQTLLVDAGLLVRDKTAAGGVRIDTGRCAAMLALTAVHDVMKLKELCPV